MKLSFWGDTNVGKRRENNQDCFLADGSLKLFAVADGMGGHKGGEVASARAIEILKESFEQYRRQKVNRPVRDLLTDAFLEASQKIHRKSTVENPELMGMGTTMVSCFIVDKTVYIANVGDSRCYLVRDKNIWRLTEDHSLVYEQIKAGLITGSDDSSAPARNVITRSVGFEREVNVDVIEREIQAGDSFLLSSDGLHGMLEDSEILNVVQNSLPPKVVGKCIDAANQAGGDDNISVVYILPNP
jgi:serine/threonine protein phosphatase PrpC